MKHVKLFYRNGAIKTLFDAEVERRVRVEYSEHKEKEILRNMLVDTDTALAYAGRGEHYVRGHYSRDDEMEHMKEKVRRMMEESRDPAEKEALRKCMEMFG